MFDQLKEVHQPEVTRKSATRVLGWILVLGFVLGIRVAKLLYYDTWRTWNPFNEVGLWFVIVPAALIIWRYIPAILDRFSKPTGSTGNDAT
jgi:hypothetical protein